MNLSKLSPKCEKCKRKDTCTEKEKVACGAFTGVEISVADKTTQSLLPNLTPAEIVQKQEPYENWSKIKEQMQNRIGVRRL